MTDQREGEFAIVVVPVAEGCWQNAHRTIRFDDGIVCATCSEVAAEARNRGESHEQAEATLAAYRAGGARS